VEQNEKSITTLLEICNDEEDIEEVENEGLSLPPHRYKQNVLASTWRAKRAGK
jgi:hypothetical protein